MRRRRRRYDMLEIIGIQLLSGLAQYLQNNMYRSVGIELIEKGESEHDKTAHSDCDEYHNNQNTSCCPSYRHEEYYWEQKND